MTNRMWSAGHLKKLNIKSREAVRTGRIDRKHNPANGMAKSLGPMDIYNLTGPFLYNRKYKNA